MPELIDKQWFCSIAGDAETLEHISEAAQMQEIALSKNQMPVDNEVWSLNLNGIDIKLEKTIAVNALEIFQEIFRDLDHVGMDDFIPASDDVVLDLGANLGFYAIFAKKVAPECRYYGVEPNPYIFPLLEKNISQYKDAEVLNAAIGKSDYFGSFELIRQLPSIGGATLRQIERKWLDKSIIEEIEIKFMTMESIISYYNIPCIDLLKIDIEGYEGELLESTPRQVLDQVNRIVMETHSPELKSRVVDRLIAAGFELVKEDSNLNNSNYCNLYFRNSNYKKVHNG